MRHLEPQKNKKTLVLNKLILGLNLTNLPFRNQINHLYTYRQNRCKSWISSVCQKSNRMTPPTCERVGGVGGYVYFQKPWNLSSRQDPISPAVWCGNCTVMAFYVAALRWLIIYTLHTPSPCYSNFTKLMTCSEHDGKLWPQ